MTRMAKIAKAAAKTAQKLDKDLFSDLPEAAPRRLAGRARRAAKPAGGAEGGYTARDIEVLEGLEPVRRRPGMYIGGTDEKALHHLFAEVIDNSMDEALEGHATFIEVELEADGFVTVTDNGRGIPVDPHPKFKNKSALEVIMCTLHAGGKFEFEGVRHLGRPARRRGLGRQRALRAHGGGGRARADALPHGVRARQAEGQAGKARPRAQPARHQGALPARSRHFRRKGAFQAGARLQDGALQGLFVRRRRDSLVVREGTSARCRGRAGGGHFPFRRRAQGIPVRGHQRRDPGPPRYFRRQRGQGRRPRRRAMGGGVDRRQRRLPVLLLQHDPDAGRRHARSPACAVRC